nr:MAG TPA: hypothetical protein [Caudoviricetes sp.]
MELQQTQFCIDALIRTQRNHVCLKVRNVEGQPGGLVSERNEVYNLIHVALFILHEALTLNFTRPSSYRVSLNTRFKVCEAMSAEIPFERVFLVGRTFLSPTCFLTFCHDTKLKNCLQRYLRKLAHEL